MRDALNLPPVAVLAKALVEVMSCDWHIRYVVILGECPNSRSADIVATMRGEHQ